MKRYALFLFILLIGSIQNVLAKDFVYSINKYLEEKLTKIEVSYDKEGQIDGMITAGMIQEEVQEEDSNTIQEKVIIIKYKQNGKVAWTYSSEESKKEALLDLDYTYDSENKIDGYLITTQKTYNIEETESIPRTTFLKLDLEGNLIWEKGSGFYLQEIVPMDLKNHTQKGYIALTTTSFVQYDAEMNVIWSKDYLNKEEYSYKDIFPLYEENEITGYIMSRFSLSSEMIDIIFLNPNGEEQVLLSSNDKTISIQTSEDGFILYGMTDKVKLTKGNTSYYVTSYDREGTVLWELIGETAINENQRVILLPREEGDYFLLYQSQEDNSYEVVKLNKEGLVEKKVKKIKNDYYHFEDYSFIGDTLYFIGQIDCPEEDNCDYKQKSLFLISDEDKIIEVKAKDNGKVIIMLGIMMGLMFSTILLKRKK